MSGVSRVNLGKSACWLFVEIRSSVSPPIVYPHVMSLPREESRSIHGVVVSLPATPAGFSSCPSVFWDKVHTVSLGLNMGASWFIGSYHFEMLS